MSGFRFPLDEHVDPALRTGLRRLAPDVEVWLVGDSGTPRRGTPDPELLGWCEAHEFILITNNRRTMPIHLRAHVEAGGHVPGIFMLGTRASLRGSIDELTLIQSASSPDEYVDRITYLPLTR